MINPRIPSLRAEIAALKKKLPHVNKDHLKFAETAKEIKAKESELNQLLALSPQTTLPLKPIG